MNFQLLEKFFKKECTPEEVEQVLKWFNEPSEKPNTLSALEKQWEEFNLYQKIPNDNNPESQLAKIHKLLNQKQNISIVSPIKTKPKKIGIKKFKLVLQVAAVITIALLGSVFIYDKLLKIPDEEVYLSKSNPTGQKSTLHLADGSKVILNAASSLTYPEKFLGSERRIQLNGEAFFEVAKDPNHPFIVESNGIATIALGTSFNIKAYTTDSAISVALATGKVKVRVENHEIGKTTNSYYLVPGESLTYNVKENNFTKETYNPAQTLAWKDGTIYFKDATLEQVILTLERWYGVTFEINNYPSDPWKYTGEFHKENLENVLISIGYAKEFQFTIKDKNVKILFNQLK